MLKQLHITGLIIIISIIIAGCAGRVQRVESPPKDSYTVRGKTYYPVKTVRAGYVSKGVASWYGPGFHGKKTSCGEIYDMHGLTAAHKILPMNTVVRVTNMENGKEVTVRINDRGPFIDGRDIDLSLSAAKAVDMVGPGTAPVRIAVLGNSGMNPEPGPPNSPATTGPVRRPNPFFAGAYPLPTVLTRILGFPRQPTPADQQRVTIASRRPLRTQE